MALPCNVGFGFCFVFSVLEPTYAMFGVVWWVTLPFMAESVGCRKTHCRHRIAWNTIFWAVSVAQVPSQAKPVGVYCFNASGVMLPQCSSVRKRQAGLCGMMHAEKNSLRLHFP